MKKPRRPLNDALADQFVYGTNSEPTPPPPAQIEPEATNPPEPTEVIIPSERLVEAVTPSKMQKEASLMSKLQLPEKEPTVRFTVDLSQSMHRKLSILAAKTGQKKADIVRLLLEDVLKEEVEE